MLGQYVVAMGFKLAVNNNCVSWGLNRKPRIENEVSIRFVSNLICGIGSTLMLERRTYCRGVATWTLWPLPHTCKFRTRDKLFSCAELHLQLQDAARISSDRAINEQVIQRASPARGQSTPGKWRSTKGKVTTRL